MSALNKLPLFYALGRQGDQMGDLAVFRPLRDFFTRQFFILKRSPILGLLFSTEGGMH
jgi:hypothetical protein